MSSSSVSRDPKAMLCRYALLKNLFQSCEIYEPILCWYYSTYISDDSVSQRHLLGAVTVALDWSNAWLQAMTWPAMWECSVIHEQINIPKPTSTYTCTYSTVFTLMYSMHYCTFHTAMFTLNTAIDWLTKYTIPKVNRYKKMPLPSSSCSSHMAESSFPS